MIIFKTIDHETLKVGDRWLAKSETDDKIKSILIVAVDAGPKDILCVNIVIERPDATDGCLKVLAPIDYKLLKPSLIKVLNQNVDVSEHIESYQNWKSLANQSKAGMWTMNIDKIVTTIKKAAMNR